jgi:hypothetical protein
MFTAIPAFPYKLSYCYPALISGHSVKAALGKLQRQQSGQSTDSKL